MKKILILFIGLTFIVTAKGQLLGSLNLDPKDFIQIKDSAYQDVRLLKRAISSSFFISRQSFQVCDKKTGELYGLNNKNEFGTEISLGIKVKNGYILTDKAIRPWEYNAKFEKFKDNYQPVPYLSEYSECVETAKYDSLDISKQKVKELIPSSLYFVNSDCLSNKGLTIDFARAGKDGWVVWACTDKNADLNKTPKLEFFCYNNAADASNDKNIDIEAPDGKKVLGGIFVIPISESVGVLEFHLCGVMVEMNGKWSICFPFQKDMFVSNSTNVDKQKNDEGENKLTPISQAPKTKSKKKKNKK